MDTPWTEEQVNELAERRNSGDSYSAIAGKLGRTEAAALSKAKRIGLPVKEQFWTAKRVEELKRLWAAGDSCSEIAAKLGIASRNAIIGKVRRLNLPRRVSPEAVAGFKLRSPRMFDANGIAVLKHKRRERSARSRTEANGDNALKMRLQRRKLTHAKRPQAKRQSPPLVPIDDLAVPVGLNVSLLALTDAMCKWPSGDPGSVGFHFCGHRNFGGYSYCEYHSRIAYTPATERSLRQLDRIASYGGMAR